MRKNNITSREDREGSKRLVFGVGPGVFGGLSPSLFGYLLANLFDNNILVSALYISGPQLKVIKKHRPHFFLDSGGFTLYRRQSKTEPEEFGKMCETAKRKLLRILKEYQPGEVFELDNDYFKVNDDLMSTDNFLRKEVFEILGKYPIPVFKFHQGMRYWVQLCEEYPSDYISIGGLAQDRAWHTKTEELKTMVAFARSCGKKVHLLGCSNMNVTRAIRPDTIDYNIERYAIGLNKYKLEMGYPKEMKVPHSEYARPVAAYGIAEAMIKSDLYESYTAI